MYFKVYLEYNLYCQLHIHLYHSDDVQLLNSIFRLVTPTHCHVATLQLSLNNHMLQSFNVTIRSLFFI